MSTPSSVPGTTAAVPGDDIGDGVRDDVVPGSAVDADLADVLRRLVRLEAVAAELDARLDADADADAGPDADASA